MQAQMSKKDKSPVIRCPRCHAESMAMQGRCGRCGYIFPVKGAYKGEKRGRMPGTGAPPPVPQPSPPAGAGMMGEMGGREGQKGENPEGPPKPTRPKAIPEKGIGEGLLGAPGRWISCPRCGADVKPDAKRCGRCGYKPG